MRVYALSRAWPDAPSMDIRHKTWSILTHIETGHHMLSLASFVVFLCDGRLSRSTFSLYAHQQKNCRYRTWADRLLHLRLVPSQPISTRQVSYEFMNRQMVWHAFTVCSTPSMRVIPQQLTIPDPGISTFPVAFNKHTSSSSTYATCSVQSISCRDYNLVCKIGPGNARGTPPGRQGQSSRATW